MERDEVIFRDSFGGLLSVLITLSPGEVTTMQAPAPLLKQVMRGAPLSSLADVVRSHFSNSTTVFNSSLSIWFEDALTLKPLRSDWPCGHVKDLIDYSDQEEHDDLAFETKRRPWHIIVHFKNQPDGALPFSLRNGTDAQVGFDPSCCGLLYTIFLSQKSFFETFKQSTYLRYGSGKPALVLSAEEQSRLWDGLRQASYSEAFVTMSRSETIARDSNLPPLRVPVRFFVATPGKPPLQRYIQRPLECDERTLQQTAAELFGDREGTFRVNGITVAPETPLQWLHAHMPAADGFLYVTLVLPTPLQRDGDSVD
ncbi:MAG: hypothetical protein MHM6MM_000164 [Cercozoa sp. M6MM]